MDFNLDALDAKGQGSAAKPSRFKPRSKPKVPQVLPLAMRTLRCSSCPTVFRGTEFVCALSVPAEASQSLRGTG